MADSPIRRAHPGESHGGRRTGCEFMRHNHSAYWVRFPVYHTAEPLRRFAAESCFSTARTDISLDTFNQHVFSVDHEYFILRLKPTPLPEREFRG